MSQTPYPVSALEGLEQRRPIGAMKFEGQGLRTGFSRLQLPGGNIQTRRQIPFRVRVEEIEERPA